MIFYFILMKLYYIIITYSNTTTLNYGNFTKIIEIDIKYIKINLNKVFKQQHFC